MCLRMVLVIFGGFKYEITGRFGVNFIAGGSFLATEIERSMVCLGDSKYNLFFFYSLVTIRKGRTHTLSLKNEVNELVYNAFYS